MATTKTVGEMADDFADRLIASSPLTESAIELARKAIETAVTGWIKSKPRQNSRYVYGWLSRPYADTPARYLESPPQTSGYCWRTYFSTYKAEISTGGAPRLCAFRGVMCEATCRHFRVRQQYRVVCGTEARATALVRLLPEPHVRHQEGRNSGMISLSW
jgi:hypothetical protein